MEKEDIIYGFMPGYISNKLSSTKKIELLLKEKGPVKIVDPTGEYAGIVGKSDLEVVKEIKEK
ncbi:hypothetical protein BBG03_03350 [Streptococcus dysgalactiae subsp. equisimilis]|uniref:hypothetical protein n=1 Tax=Streptococcus dysgalactiae TaxID=1334 RepID=UPI000807EE60|nr:hypothetical protein [Streptococcus dysgalactiae]OBZ00631.1 hypothetical protein BBG03_03350 [Streptococcus dysgalactiae subsp. equisimilis]